MNSDHTKLGIDGVAFGVTMKASNTENDVDINELKRKLERKETDNKKKDREISVLQKEILTMTTDIQNLRLRNEQLQTSMSSARLVTTGAREDNENKLANQKILDMEKLIEGYDRRETDAAVQMEGLRAENAGLLNQLKEAFNEINKKASDLNIFKEEANSSGLKLKTAHIRINEKDNDLEGFRQAFESLQIAHRKLTSDFDHVKAESNMRERSVVELTSENKSLRAALIARNETNSLLRDQMIDVNERAFVVSKSDMDGFKRIEKENELLQSRSKDLVKSVELHMDLLQRSENEATSLKARLDKALEELENYKENMKAKLESASTSASTFDALKKEVVKLRRENREFASRIDSLMAGQNGGSGGKVPSGQGHVGHGHASRGQEGEVVQEEKQHRRMMEESVRTLRSRVAFLLEQMDQASQMSVMWKEQKTLLKAEIQALHHANVDLRERLLNVQRNFMDKALYDIGVSVYGGKPKQKAGTFITSDLQYGKDPNEEEILLAEDIATKILINNQTKPKDKDPVTAMLLSAEAQPLPPTSESLVERQLFDVICGFTSGERESHDDIKPGKPKPAKKTSGVKGKYVVTMNVDGLLALSVEGDDARDSESEELLSTLQLHSFLRFTQTRNPDKIVVMFCEKIAALLNFFRGTIHDYLIQLGEARMVGAKLQSKVSVSGERVENMKEAFSVERIAKQKSVMKYVREQMRISDLRKLLMELSIKAVSTLDEIDVRRRDIMNAFPSMGSSATDMAEGRHIKDLINHMMSVADQLAASTKLHSDENMNAVDGGPAGSLDVKLQESVIDDETLHGVVGLICGALGPAAVASAEIDKTQNDTIALFGINPEPTQEFSKAHMALMSSLNVGITGDKASAAAVMAKSLLLVQSNYSNRILMLGLRDNELTDLSCKTLSVLVEKSSSLRMLDLRGNMISGQGCKMLFDATRKNTSVLYVTHKQNGLMIEGHREIMGEAKSAQKSNAHQPEEELEENNTFNSDPMKETNVKIPKFPLRIDIRNNNPEKDAAERLLQSISFKPSSNIKGTQDATTGKMSKTGYTNESNQTATINATRNLWGEVIQDAPTPQWQTQRPKSAHTPQSSSRLGEGVSGAGIFRPMSSNPYVSRPVGNGNTHGLSPMRSYNSSAVAQQQIQQQNSQRNVAKLFDESDSVGDDDNDEYIRTDGDEENDLDPRVKSRLDANKEAKILGTGMIGSLLDKQIRQFQEKVSLKIKLPSKKASDLREAVMQSGDITTKPKNSLKFKGVKQKQVSVIHNSPLVGNKIVQPRVSISTSKETNKMAKSSTSRPLRPSRSAPTIRMDSKQKLDGITKSSNKFIATSGILF